MKLGNVPRQHWNPMCNRKIVNAKAARMIKLSIPIGVSVLFAIFVY